MSETPISDRFYLDCPCDLHGKTIGITYRRRSLKECHEHAVELERQLAEAKAEIEAMRPMVEACKAKYERHSFYMKNSNEPYPCQCLTCQWYRDYLDRKQP